MREEIPYFVLASPTSLQLRQGAPASTTSMPYHLILLSYLAVRLSGLFRTILMYFSPSIPFPFSCIFTWWDVQSCQVPLLAMSNCTPHHEALFRRYTCFRSRYIPPERILTKDTSTSSLMVCL